MQSCTSLMKTTIICALLCLLFPPLARAENDLASAKIMIMIDEKIAGIFQTTAYEDMGQAEATLQDILINSGFMVVDPRTTKANISRDQALRILEGDNFAAASAGLQYGAEVVITGKAFSKQAGMRLQGSQMQSMQGVVQIRAIRSDDGTVFFSRSEQAAAAHIDEVQGGVAAIRKASEAVGQALTHQLSAALKTPDVGQQSRPVTIMITNLVSYRHLSSIKHFFETELPGVRSAHQRSYTMGNAEMVLEFSGAASDLAEELAHRRFPGFRLEPTNVTPNRVDLRAVLD